MSTTTSADQELIGRFEEFLTEYYREDILDLADHYPSERESLYVTFGDLERFDANIADDFVENPERLRELAELALAEVPLPIDVNLSDANVRVTDLPDWLTTDVGAERIDRAAGSFRGIRGQVSKQTEQQLFINQAVFECQRCGTPTPPIPQRPGDFQEPHECQGCERQGPFMYKPDESVRVPYQQIRLQAPPEVSLASDRTLDVALRGDLVDDVCPGDRVVVNTRVETQLKQGQQNQPIEVLHGKADSVTRLETTFEDIDIGPHRDRIEEIASSDDPYQKIVDSIAPSLMGYDDIKEAIAYQMFGGVDKTLPDGSKRRGSSHMLLVGDPGLGKSMLLQYAEELSPRAIYTTGKQSTAAGLTASAVKDDFGDGGWTLEAGAVVEADQGLAAIDEFDKMHDDDRAALMEAMSDQRINVSKAGINATLPARTTILAAANPRNGRYDQYEPIGEQIDLDPALISRFDLIFTMADKPDKEFDQRVASHMNEVARAGQQLARGEAVESGAADPAIEPDVLRAYIAHARDIVPVFTDEAMTVFEEEYVALRQANDDDNVIPTTARMVEALHRLAEASARIRLSEEITAADARRVVRIHRSCLEDVGIDPETGEFDADVIETGKSRSQQERYDAVLNIIRELVDEHGTAPEDDLMSEAVSEGFTTGKVEHTITQLKRDGEIYPAGDGYRVS